MTAVRRDDTPWRRLPWLVPAAFVIALLSLMSFLDLLARSPSSPVLSKSVEVGIIELPMSAQPSPGPVAPAPEPTVAEPPPEPAVTPPPKEEPAPELEPKADIAPPEPKVEETPPPPEPEVTPPPKEAPSEIEPKANVAPPEPKVEATPPPEPPPPRPQKRPSPPRPATRQQQVRPAAPPASAANPAATPEAPPHPAAPQTATPQLPSGGSAGARAIFQPMPQIPDDLRRHRVNAVAIVVFHVAPDGNATVDLREATDDPRLNQVLLEGFKRWRFFPALDHDKPVASILELRVPIEVR